MRPVAKVASVFLGFVAIAHLLRVAFQIEVVARGVVLPMWMSGVGAALTGGLAVALWREARG